MRCRYLLTTLGAAAGLAAAAPATASAAGWSCVATTASGSLLGGQAVQLAPAANLGTDECRPDDAGMGFQALGPLLGGTFIARTGLTGDTPAQQRATAHGGIADLRVLSLPNLGVALPELKIPDTFGAVRVELPQSVDELPTALTTTLTDTVESLDATGQLDDLLMPVTGTLDGLGGTLGGLLGGGMLGTGTDPTLILDELLASLPDNLTVDLRPALGNLLPALSLPELELLRIKGALAAAQGRCVDGEPELVSNGHVADVTVLGQNLPLDALLQRTLTLLDPANLDPSALPLGAIALPGGLSLGDSLLGPILEQALGSTLASLGDIDLPATLADVRVTPPQQVRNAEGVLQDAGRVYVAIAGQPIVDISLGRAVVAARDVECSTEGAQSEAPADAGELECTDRRIVLTGVTEHSREVRFEGVAAEELVGERVRIRFDHTDRTVATTRVREDGTFRGDAARPAERLRDSNKARYTAIADGEKSLSLKLRRRMRVTSMRVEDGKVRIAGRVERPLGEPVREIEIRQRVTCDDYDVVGTVKPDRDSGWFKVRLDKPEGDSAVYRLTTEVRNNTRSPKHYETFTLPQSVDLTD